MAACGSIPIRGVGSENSNADTFPRTSGVPGACSWRSVPPRRFRVPRNWRTQTSFLPTCYIRGNLLGEGFLIQFAAFPDKTGGTPRHRRSVGIPRGLGWPTLTCVGLEVLEQDLPLPQPVHHPLGVGQPTQCAAKANPINPLRAPLIFDAWQARKDFMAWLRGTGFGLSNKLL